MRLLSGKHLEVEVVGKHQLGGSFGMKIPSFPTHTAAMGSPSDKF